MTEIPHKENPFVCEDQKELVMAWELGWFSRDSGFAAHCAEVSTWAIEFRQRIRAALSSCLASNAATPDEELIQAIHELVANRRG